MENKFKYCLVTGASRGIGKGFVEALLSKGKTVIACVRDPTSLEALQNTSPYKSSLIITQLEITDETRPWTLIEELKTTHNIPRLDLIISNIGVGSSYEHRHVADSTTQDLIHSMQVNTFGPMRLFQACLPLLEKSSCATFVYISSALGSITLTETNSWAALGYGSSKAAGNFMTKSIHVQHKDIVAVALHPGLVDTEMGKTFSKAFTAAVGIELPSITIDESVSSCLSVIFDATKDRYSGKFMSYDGTELAY